MVLTQRTDSFIHLTRSQLDQTLCALCVLGLIEKDQLKSRSLTILGPFTPFITQTQAEVEATEQANPSPKDNGDATPLCGECGSIFRPVKRWYAVTRGLDIGVFEGWPTVQSLVQTPDNLAVAISGAFSKVFETREEANKFFLDALQAGAVGKLSLE